MAKSVPGFESNWELGDFCKFKSEDNMPGRMVQNTY